MSAADSITFARPADGRTTLAKIIRVEGDRIVGKEASPNVFRFRYVEVPVHDLGSLYLAVKRAADQGAIAIRAKPKGPVGNRRMHDQGDGVAPHLEIAARHWVGFDWDGLPLEPQPCPNPSWFWLPDALLEPWIGAQIALRRLPPAFRNVSCFWQVTAGAGYSDGFRLRTWHWLNHPVTGAEPKRLQPAIERGLVDPVTLVEVQPHYLGVQVDGGPDPCPRRFGFLRLARQEVVVPDIAGIRRRQEEIEQAKRPPELRHAPHDPDQAQTWAQGRIDECIAAIRSAAARHPTYKEEAARALAIARRYGLDWPPIRRDLIAAYESNLTPAEARERRRRSTEGVLDWLEKESGMTDRTGTAPDLEDLDRQYAEEATAAKAGNGTAGPVATPLVGVPVEDLIKMQLPERPRLLGPWLTTSSLVMVHARTGVGKTWFSMAAFQALATGGTFLKWTADRPRKVLYLDGEMPGAQIQERGRLLLNGKSTNGNLVIVTPDLQTDPMPNLATEQGRTRLEPLLAGCDGLAIDHITALIRCHGDGSEGDLWIDQVQPWLLEKRRAGLAILLDHHSGKGGAQRGTSVREDILDVIIKLEQVGEERDGARFKVVFEKTRGFYGREAETFEAHLSTLPDGTSCWTTSDAAESDEFMAFVEMLRDKVPVDRAAKDLKIHRATAYRWKGKAIDKGLIT